MTAMKKISALCVAAMMLMCVGLRADDAAPMPFDTLKAALDVGLVVTNEEAAKRFYGDVLGLKFQGNLPLPGNGKMLRYASGATTIKLIVLPEPKPVNPGGIQAAVGIRLITLFDANLDAIAERAEANGLPKPSILGAKGSAGRLIFINDPDGNQVEILGLPADAAPEAAQRFMIGLTVADTERSREFYGKTLGLTELGNGPLFGKTGPMKYNFQAGSTTIKFWQFPKELPVQTGSYDAASGIRYFTFMVKDVDAVHEKLVAAGAKIAQAPADFGGLARVMFVEDPDGNWIEFAQVGGRKPAN